MRTIRCRQYLQTTQKQVLPATLRRHRQLLLSTCPCPKHLGTGLAAIGLAATLAGYGNADAGVTAVSPATPTWGAGPAAPPPTSDVTATAVNAVPAINAIPAVNPVPAVNAVPAVNVVTATAPASSPTASSPTTVVAYRTGGVLRPGNRGPAVLDLQQRLAAAGYWLGPVDGSYGPLTQQAVLALQKAAGISTDGLAGPATAAALQQGVRPRASSTRGQVLEVDLARQLFLVVRDGTVEQVFNTSTGSGQWYEVDGVQRLAVTPPGTYRVFREVDGVDRAPLGELYRPKYFNGGIAVHGYPSVPARPVSHGCVRLTNAAMDWLWSSGNAPVSRVVMVR